MDTFITPCILPDTDSVHQVTPVIHRLSSPEKKGAHPSNALEYFLGEMERINLFQIQDNDESNIEHVPDWYSDNCLMLFDMAVEPDVPPDKRFKLLLTNYQPRSHDKEVESTSSSSQSVQTVRIHNRNSAAKTMRSPPKGNEWKVLVPPARSDPTLTMGNCPKSVKTPQNAPGASQSEVIVHFRLTKDDKTKALDTPPRKLAAKTSVLDTPPRESATKVLSPRSGEKKIPPCTLLRSSSAKTISAHSGISPRSDEKKISLGAHFLRCSSDKTTSIDSGSRDAKSIATEDTTRKKRILFCNFTADDPHESTRVFMANGRELVEI